MQSEVSVESLQTSQSINYVLDTNVLIHDPTAVFNFEEHHVVIPITVLEELDKLKRGNNAQAADCRQAIRSIDAILSHATPAEIERGVPIKRESDQQALGKLSISMSTHQGNNNIVSLQFDNNDNRIINEAGYLKQIYPEQLCVLVTKDINMRLKARGCGIDSQDYQNDQLVSDIELLHRGYIEFSGSFWNLIGDVNTHHENGQTWHRIPRLPIFGAVCPNQFFLDDQGFIGRVTNVNDEWVSLVHLDRAHMLDAEYWGLQPRDIYQAMALNLLMDPNVHLVNLTGAAGSGKTILALAAAMESTVVGKQYRRIIATRSTQGLDEDIGFLPGTEKEKMEPWLGAITDNLEALHVGDEDCDGSVDYVLNKVPLHFKSLNYIRGRSFQHSLIIIDEAQNLTPHQIKTIVTRAGSGSKVICLGNLAQIDTPYLGATSSGLTYLAERFKNFPHGGHIQLQGVPRSLLAEYAALNL